MSKRTFGVPDVIRLRPGQLWKVTARPGEIAIDCRRGSVWITQEGDRRDFVLRAGERFVNRTRGRVVAQALSATRLRVTRRALRRWWPWLAVLPAMAAAGWLARRYVNTSPGFGVALAVAIGLWVYWLCDELDARRLRVGRGG